MRDQDRRTKLRIQDMLDSIGHVRAATATLDLDSYLDQRVIQLATERAIEIISEASRDLPAELKETTPEIPWQKVAGIGNILRHDYRDVAPRII